MTLLTWWMRIVGALYVFLSVASSILKIPIEAEGPPGILAAAAGGDPTARFVVETWFTFGLYLGAIGLGLLVASRAPQRARALVVTVIGVELAGIVADVHKIANGYPASVSGTWILIHAVLIATGVMALRRAVWPPVA